jgi:hypothetical protein
VQKLLKSNGIAHRIGILIGKCLRTRRAICDPSDFRQVDRARMEELADRSETGTLTADEEAEFDSYLHVANLLTVMHSEARLALRVGPADTRIRELCPDPCDSTRSASIIP